MIEINSVDRLEVMRYLGYGSSIPDKNVLNLMNECENRILQAVKPRFVYRLFDIVSTENGISAVGTQLLLKGKDIAEHLSGCKKAVFMCATISADVDALIRSAQISDMTEALILDCMASSVAEQVCSSVSTIVDKEFPDYFKTWRYSPGYGDFPIDIQNDFLNVIDASKKTGVCVTESGILTPRKSITAVIGLSETELPRKKSSCESCNMSRTCNIRKRSEHCGF